jgi:hypothetical protein
VSQSRAMSAVEAVANVIVGYVLAVGLQLLLFPAFGLHPTLGQTLQIGGWFTLLSLLRSYALRRLFERLRREAAR